MLNNRNSKPIFFIAALLSLICFNTNGQVSKNSQQQCFEAANDLYNQQKYTEAAQVYQQLMDEGAQQKALYFNAGNAYYKAGKIGQSIYNYEKALQLSPDDSAVKHNLFVANQKVTGYIEELPLVFFQRWWLLLQQFHTANGWASGCILFFWLLIAGIILNNFIPGWKNKGLRWANYFTGTLSLLYLLMAIGIYQTAHDHHVGIVMAKNIKVKMAPNENSKDAFEIQEGLKVQVSDATSDFCKILLPDGKNGWINCNDIKRL